MTENLLAGVEILTINVTDNDKPDSNDILADITLSGDDAQYFTVEVFGTYGVLQTRYELLLYVSTMYSVLCTECTQISCVN